MTWLGRVLDPATFVRIHRGTIVRLTSIAELISASHGDMTMRLKDGTELAVSRQYRPRLEASLRG
jgi:two-component system LytT family response regulator